ncbi:hypothetical protein [Actinomadura xylanilytica]|uniref:hypothetical protein n=1 Tax=Actinomadura xylanilytica TaxID=887459 RepID=UPI00255B0FBD|nr:hypothetical protein [Actinomadura xylanilytica]MDL4771400.1 hypothetical protein [Actinomadura xylanilytica]
MRDEGDVGAAVYGRVPARVVLRGEPGGWHYVIVDKASTEERHGLAGPGVRWRTGGGNDPEPPWWRRRLADAAEAMRETIAWRLTDRTFAELGVEADIAWFAVDDPVSWEGLVTLRDPDPARFPGRAAPFLITLEPGRGALLPDASLLFSTRAPDVWATLAAVAERCATAPPTPSPVCGWAGHQGVRVGRGRLALSTERGADGVERLGEIFGTRGPGWGGSPELRVRLDGIDLLDETAADVVALFRELGHEVVRRGRTVRLPALGLMLSEPEPEPTADGDAVLEERFTGVSLQPPSDDAPAPRWARG